MNCNVKKCVWLVSKLIIAAVALLSICLLIQDLKADTNQNTVHMVISYGFLFILNTKLMCDVLFKSKGSEGLIFFWAIFYVTCLIIKVIMISMNSSSNSILSVPVTSATATNFVIHMIGLDQHARVTTGFWISAAFIFIVITFHLFMILSDVPAEINRQRLPVYYLSEQIHGMTRDLPPRYTSRENIPVPPNNITALLHASVPVEASARN